MKTIASTGRERKKKIICIFAGIYVFVANAIR